MPDIQLTCPSLIRNPEKQKATWWNRLMKKSLAGLLGGIQSGSIKILYQDGRTEVFGKTDFSPKAMVHLHSYRMLRKLLIEGDVGLAESYIDGDWDTPDLVQVLALGPRNMEGIEKKILGHPLYRLRNLLQHVLHRNSRSGSRRNIADHYDLGNDFYRLWLDPTMTYSSGLFDQGTNDLVSAQEAKYRKIAGELDLQPGQRVLEIGCGWGGFAEFAAREYGCRVEGITISEEQLDYARKRISRAGLSDLVEIRFQDYRDLEGQYDRVISIEMLEAVGEKNWPVYFKVLEKCLKPMGYALIQTILLSEERFDDYRKKADFIQLYVFPGGMLPCMKSIEQHIRMNGMSIDRAFHFGISYAQTLNCWRKRFQQSLKEIEQLGFNRRFQRLWNYYLAYCETGFRTGASDVVILSITKK